MEDVYKKLKEDKQKKKMAAMSIAEADDEASNETEGEIEQDNDSDDSEEEKKEAFRQKLFDGKNSTDNPDEMFKVNLFTGHELPAAEHVIERKVENMEIKLSLADAPADEAAIIPQDEWKEVNFSDSFDEFIILSLEKECPSGKNYHLAVKIDYLDEVVNVVAKITASECAPGYSGGYVVTFTVAETYFPLLEKIKKVYERRQSNIFSFMKIAKGG